MYDPVSEKMCEYNLHWCIDTDSTIIVITNKSGSDYKIELPFSNISVGTIFEIANDFVKLMCVHTEMDVSDYF